MTDIVLVDTIAKVDPSEWDELANKNIMASYAWLRLVEDTSLEPRLCQCLLAREGSQLQAAAYFWEHHPSTCQNTIDYVVFGQHVRLAGLLGLTVLPSFVGSEVAGHRQTILFKDNLSGPDRQRLLSQMLHVLENHATLKKRTLCFRGIPTHDTDLAAVFTSRHYLCSPELPACCLDIQWKSFDEYLQSLRKQHTRSVKCIRNEIRKSHRAGITIQRWVESPVDYARLHSLADSHYRRLNNKPFPFRPAFFEQIQARLGHNVAIDTAVKDHLIIGVQLRLSREGHATVPIIGIDTEHARTNAVYFNLAYNHAIRDAIEEGLHHIRFGTLVYDTKLKRGCHLSHANLYLRPRNSFSGLLLKPLMGLRTLRMRQMQRSLTEKTHGLRSPDLYNYDGDRS